MYICMGTQPVDMLTFRLRTKLVAVRGKCLHSSRPWCVSASVSALPELPAASVAQRHIPHITHSALARGTRAAAAVGLIRTTK